MSCAYSHHGRVGEVDDAVMMCPAPLPASVCCCIMITCITCTLLYEQSLDYHTIHNDIYQEAQWKKTSRVRGEDVHA